MSEELDFNDLQLTPRAKNALGRVLSVECEAGNYDALTGTMYGGFHLAGIAETLNEKGVPIFRYRGIGKKSGEEITAEFARHGLELTRRCPTCGRVYWRQ